MSSNNSGNKRRRVDNGKRPEPSSSSSLSEVKLLDARFTDRNISDFILWSENKSRAFYVSKYVLSKASGVMKVWFNDPECKEVVLDCPSDVLLSFLRYVHVVRNNNRRIVQKHLGHILLMLHKYNIDNSKLLSHINLELDKYKSECFTQNLTRAVNLVLFPQIEDAVVKYVMKVPNIPADILNELSADFLVPRIVKYTVE
jgi:hypothetical protein